MSEKMTSRPEPTEAKGSVSMHRGLGYTVVTHRYPIEWTESKELAALATSILQYVEELPPSNASSPKPQGAGHAE